MSSGPTHSLNASIVHRADLAPDLAIFRVAPDSGGVPPFEPGQYATLGLPGEGDPNQPQGEGQALIRRAMSIASATIVRDWYEFYVLHVEGGRFTTPLWSLGVGGRLRLDEHVRGHFTLADVPTDADLLMIATGTGLAPYMSMLRTYAPAPAPGRRWRRAALIHGVRLARDLGYRDELQARASTDETFAYLPTVTREPPTAKWSGLRGRIPSLLDDQAALEERTGFPLDPARVHVMLCGSPAMIQDMETLLQSRNFRTKEHGQPGNIHFERYW